MGLFTTHFIGKKNVKMYWSKRVGACMVECAIQLVVNPLAISLGKYVFIYGAFSSYTSLRSRLAQGGISPHLAGLFPMRIRNDFSFRKRKTHVCLTHPGKLGWCDSYEQSLNPSRLGVFAFCLIRDWRPDYFAWTIAWRLLYNSCCR